MLSALSITPNMRDREKIGGTDEPLGMPGQHEKAILRLVIFTFDILLCANERPEAIAVVKRTSPFVPIFKNSFR